MISIQTKFIALIIGCLLIASVTIGGAGIMHAKRAADGESAKTMNLVCAERAQEVNALLSRIQQSVRTLTVYATSQLESVDRLKNDPAYLDAYTKQLHSVALNAANNTEGAMAVYVRFNPEFTPPTSGLFWSRTPYDETFRQQIPTDLSAFRPEDVERVGWYYIPIKNAKATWMKPYYNKNINVRMISFVIPLYMDSSILGVVGIDIDFSVITNIVDSISVYSNGNAFLVDTNAVVVHHPFMESGTLLGEMDGTLRPLDRDLRFGSSGNALFAYTLHEESKRMAFRPLNNGMRLAVAAPVAEIDAAKNSLISQIGIASGGILALALLLTVFMTRRLIRPLRELNEAAQKIAAGDMCVTITPQGKDEVGMLAESFQKTVEHLKKYISYINGLAYRDSLTGIKNITAYQEAEARMEEQMRLGKPEFAIVVLDINGLKHVNDTYGHDFGNMLIINACRIICKTFLHSPVFRIGGDEFVVILEGHDYDIYTKLLETLQTHLDAHNENSAADMRVSIARGIAVYQCETDIVFANVFKRADDAMYKNKATMKAAMKGVYEGSLPMNPHDGSQ